MNEKRQTGFSQNAECDDSRLGVLLHGTETSSRFRETSRHLETCQACQARLVTLAADQEEWKQLQQSLNMTSEEQMLEAEAKKRASDWCESSSSSFVWDDQMACEMLQPPTHPELLGRLGRYEIESVVGSGGMGVVFKGFDSELNRPVAVKVLAPHLSRSGAARARFAREGRAAAAIVHEHVTAIHNVEVDEKSPFLVMQYVAGRSLQARVDEGGPLRVREILRIALQTARGLAAAHEQGIVHRDVKPSNVILENGVERALLTDFGLARAADDASMTQSGCHPGTPHYMSPEQARGEAIDHRSDLFSLGSLIYFMCTGHSPFRAENTMGVLHRINHDPPRSLRSINPDIPEWLESIVFRLLEKNRGDRFGTADEVAHGLQQWLSHLQTPESSAPPPMPRAAMDRSSGLTSGSFRSGRISRWVAATATLGLLGWLGFVVVIESGKGTLRIETNGDVEVPVRILRGDEVVDTLTVTESGTSTRLRAGKYELEIAGQVDNYVIDKHSVSLQRGGLWIANVTMRHGDGRRVDDSFTLPQIEGDRPEKLLALGSSSFENAGRYLLESIFESGSRENDFRTVQVHFLGPRGLMVSDDPRAANRAVFFMLPHRVNYGYERKIPLAFHDTTDRYSGSLRIFPPNQMSRQHLIHNALQIQVTDEDLKQLRDGIRVTKVTYLPLSEGGALKLGIKVISSHQLSAGVDVVVEARKRGTPLSILMLSDESGESFFDASEYVDLDFDRVMEDAQRIEAVRSATQAHSSDDANDLGTSAKSKSGQRLSDAIPPPQDGEVLDALQKEHELKDGELTDLFETHRDSFRILRERISASVGPERVFPLFGRAQQVTSVWKCTVHFDETTHSTWPIPHSITRNGVKATVKLTEYHLRLRDGSLVELPPQKELPTEKEQATNDPVPDDMDRTTSIEQPPGRLQSE
ncbi:MAG: serine/threonine-protein kinase [Planctomycetota bacterium]